MQSAENQPSPLSPRACRLPICRLDDHTSQGIPFTGTVFQVSSIKIVGSEPHICARDYPQPTCHLGWGSLASQAVSDLISKPNSWASAKQKTDARGVLVITPVKSQGARTAGGGEHLQTWCRPAPGKGSGLRGEGKVCRAALSTSPRPLGSPCAENIPSGAPQARNGEPGACCSPSLPGGTGGLSLKAGQSLEAPQAELGKLQGFWEADPVAHLHGCHVRL